MLAPRGRFQSTGTLTVAHSKVPSPEGDAQGFQAIRPGDGVVAEGVVAEDVVAGDVVAEGTATAVPASNWPNSAETRTPTASLPRRLARGASGGLDGKDVLQTIRSSQTNHRHDSNTLAKQGKWRLIRLARTESSPGTGAGPAAPTVLSSCNGRESLDSWPDTGSEKRS
ncbi:hypothetical protein GCM10027074_33260 [Streptomyces deserti]